MTDSLPATGPTSTGRWRERLADRGIKVHPAADIFPMMLPDELEVLATDIRKNELQQGVTLYTPQRREEIGRSHPTDFYLLDGRNRLAAIELAFAGSEAELAEEIDYVLCVGSRNGEARLLYGNQDPVTFIISANAHRRHLTREQKRECIEKLLSVSPERSDREIAKSAKASHSTVAAVRAKAVGRGQIGHAPTRVDTLGRRQPAHKTTIGAINARPSFAESTSPKVLQSPSSGEQQHSPRQHSDTTHSRAMSNYHRIVEELLSALRGNPSQIAELSLERRVIMVRGAMSVFGVTLDDLQPIGATTSDESDNSAPANGAFGAASGPDGASHC